MPKVPTGITMKVTTLSEPGITRIEWEGSIDGRTAPQIREELSAAMQQVRWLGLFLSKTAVDQCDFAPSDSGNVRRFVAHLHE